MASPLVVVSPHGRPLADPSNVLVGYAGPLGLERTVWALWLNAPDAVSKRYQPSHSPEEVCNFVMDFSFVIPFGVGIVNASLSIFTNLATPAPADGDWLVGPVAVAGRRVYAQLGGGVAGTDYQLRWTAVDSNGAVWPRTALCLCAETS